MSGCVIIYLVKLNNDKHFKNNIHWNALDLKKSHVKHIVSDEKIPLTLELKWSIFHLVLD